MRPVTCALTRALTYPLVPVLVVATAVASARRPAAAEPIGTGEAAFVVVLVACWAVGLVVTWHAVAQPAGWAFLGLGTAFAWSAFTEEYAELGVVWRRDLPADELVAVLSDSSFVWWFVFLALVLQLTPPRPPEARGRRLLPVATLATGSAFQVLALLRDTPLADSLESLRSPWAIESLSVPIAVLAGISVSALGVIVIASVVQLARAWRRSAGEARQQLLWLVVGAVPLAPSVAFAYIFSWAGADDLAALVLGAATVLLLVGAALSILRYRLYDVERVVTESAAYAIASISVLAIFVGVLVVVGRTTTVDTSSQAATVLATLAGVGVARASYVWGRRAVGRQVDPTRFEAVDRIKSGLSGSGPDLDRLVADALGDRARLLYPTAQGAWVTSVGSAAVPGDDAVEVVRRGATTARLEFDPSQTERSIAQAVASEAAAEIDNVALRAEVGRQLALVTESRSRLATAHLEERRRIERDLHDGAQQRLLAIALQLQSAQVNGDVAVLRHEVDRAVGDLTATVQELRSLAAGLQPTALAGGGLLGAISDMAARVPLRLRYDVMDRRFSTSVESAAWFVVAEALANVVKHSGVDEATIRVSTDGAVLRVAVTDHGAGGADPRGRGLQGLADRVEAMGGTLEVAELVPHGTVVRAEMPCVS